MKCAKYLLLVLIAIASPAFAQRGERAGQETGFERQLNEVDDQPLREFVQSKENIDVREKASNLEISGDVRFEWRHLFENGFVIYEDPQGSVFVRKYKDITDTNGGFEMVEETLPSKFKQKYKALRGHDVIDYRDLPVSHNDWDVEFNLKLKYTFEKAWAMAHLQFDNSAGIRGHNDCENGILIFGPECGSSSSGSGFSSESASSFIEFDEAPDVLVVRNMSESCKGSGEGNNVNLKRAYMGYNIYADGVHRLDIEIGRRKLDDIFDSEIEFSSRFDGVLLKYATAVEEFADFYWTVGGFIIDERVNHVGFATELGLLDIYDTGLDLKYSYIDWTKRGQNRCFVRDALGTEFRNSQISFAYHFIPFQICKKDIPTEFYGGFLINHAAKKNIFTHNKKKNLGWYTGLYVGEVDSKGDWAFDIEYIYVQAQAVSDCDVSSIGRGNILDEHLTDVVYDPAGKIVGDTVVIIDEDGRVVDIFEGSISSLSSASSFSSSSLSCGENIYSAFLPRRGNANFRGWRFEFLYAITDNFSLDLTYEHSDAEDHHIGGWHPYSNYEIEAIYAF